MSITETHCSVEVVKQPIDDGIAPKHQSKTNSQRVVKSAISALNTLTL